MTSFEGKVIAITGAASGIGLAVAHLLASRGATISVADNREDALHKATESIKKATPNVQILSQVVDVALLPEVESWIEQTVSHFGKIDGAANIAGILGAGGGHILLEDFSEEAFDNVISVNLKGVFNCMKAEFKRLKGDGSPGGSIVNAASVAGMRGYARNVAYVASKFAIVGMTKSAAIEGGPHNVRVNCIAPGPIETRIASQVGAEVGSQLRKEYLKLVPMDRYGSPEEVAKLVAFLLGEESSYCSGGVFTVDGAMTA